MPVMLEVAANQSVSAILAYPVPFFDSIVAEEFYNGEDRILRYAA